ncbi:MAG: hypothetical protein M3Y21_12735 [Candidatus Eremiobacteraeota bacterium]|nr:hypothetical protein [Candidatus Eremiobacteraeota bacterium]
MNRSISLVALAVVAVGVAGLGNAPVRAGAQQIIAAASAPPTPPPINTVQTPLPSGPNASPPAVVVPIGGSAKATPSPIPDKTRKGISGVWEVQIQHPDTTIYTHFKLAQQQNVLTGIYMDSDSKRFPCAGSVDGKQVRIVVTKPDGSTVTFTGEVDGTTDMLGVVAIGTTETPFTAGYRPKFKFIDGINPAAGY